MKEYSLYIHIPFCKKKCNYCNFHSFAGREDQIENYVEKLVKEIKNLPAGKIKTIYFGGGTPTLLSSSNFYSLLSTIESLISNFESPISDIEITTECNPGTVDLEKLKALRKMGINRLSIGAQSFNDHHLQALGRIHKSEDIYNCVNWARQAGFDNLGLDLIFALPNQTLLGWRQTLRKAVELNPEHISTYNLQIEEGTPLWEMTKSKIPARPAGGQITNESVNPNLKLPNEDEELGMYEYAIEYLTPQGYKHYEISNFAKPGKECQHNLTYWKNENYIGIGDGAKSFDSTHTDSNRIIMGLRLMDGIMLTENDAREYKSQIEELSDLGLIKLRNHNLKLTRAGIYLANEVFERFL